MASEPPKVLISYSHDSPEHAQHVLELANHLRTDGIDCTIDQYVVAPPEGWPRWMDKQIQNSDFVVMVCTETYYQRVMGEEEPEKGLGVRWEGHLIYQAIYRAESMNTTFIPVLFESGKYAHIPAPVQSTTFYFAQTQDGYEDLYRRLTNQPRAIKPELGKLRSLPPAERKSEGAVGLESVFSNLPDRNPFFTGREQVLKRVHAALVVRGRVALSGLGGVGKTQTAVEYAHQHLHEYDHAFWAAAASREALVSSYVMVAGLLKLPGSDSQDQMLAVEAVKRWFRTHERWLLILDNADDLRTAREFIPPGKNGHVLLTTRAQAAGDIRRVEIQDMATEEGALLLLRRAKYVAEDAPLDEATEADQAAAKAFAAQVDGLPLALDQAGAFIEEAPSSPSEYLQLYAEAGAELRKRRGETGKPEHKSVHTTFLLAFEKVGGASTAVADLLRLCAFFAPDQIPEEIFIEGALELGENLGPLATNTLQRTLTIGEACRFSLLKRDVISKKLNIHRQVQAVLRDIMAEKGEDREWAERVVRAVNSTFPEVGFSNWDVCEGLLAQAKACAELIDQWGFEFPESGRLLNETGLYLYERGRYADAKPLYQQALAIREKALGPEHPDVAESLNNLATLYQAEGQHAKADPLNQRALAIREKALGGEHPDVAESLNNLAALYQAQGQYAKAEPLYKRALAIRKKVLGREHPDVAISLNNLAELYKNQGQDAKAKPLHQRSLAIRERILGLEHPDVAISLNNLAALYDNSGQYAKAEPMYQRALAIWEKALGPEHPHVAASCNNLGVFYKKQRQYAKAALMYQRALAIWEKVLGSDHSDVAKCLKNYARLLRKMGRPEEATRLEARAKAIRANTA